ncbi:MAG: DUF2652 domain-containing protein [Actinobacteria bacterium]|nr:DUF2652 domain-containing protein [Actinomycetota bacterium]
MAFGTFLLADISGHSRYLDEAGLRHASNSTAKLLNALIAASHRPWRVANIEGDAVFFVNPARVPVPDLLAHVRTLFGAFLLRVMDVSQDVDCGCGACGRANRLTVKFIAHAGDYEDRVIGRRRELIGPDVVLTHRLLKPGVTGEEYLLLTRTYLGNDAVPDLPTSDGALQLEEPVPFVVADLAPVRRDLESRLAVYVSDDEAIRRLRTEIRAEAARVWEVLTDPAAMRAWSGAQRVDAYPARDGAVGTSYQWVLPDGHEFGQLLIASDPGSRRLTFRRDDVPLLRYVYTTYRVGEHEAGSALTCAVGAARRFPLAGRVLSAFERRHPDGAADRTLVRLKELFEEG